MKKMFLLCLLTGLAVCTLSAAEDFAAKLPQLPGQKIKTNWNGPAVAAVQDGVYTIAAVLNKKTTHYSAFQVKMSGDLTNQALSFTISSNTPTQTRALYVRCYDKQNKCVASWKTWDAPVAKPTVVTLSIGKDSRPMIWEGAMVKSPGKTFEKIEFIIGHKGVAGDVYDAQFSKIDLVPQP